MQIHKRVPFLITYCFLFAGLFSSCHKKDIQVGDELAESHTRIITVDTVGVALSSYILDSFITNNNNFALIGNYHDSYVGKTTASTYLQPGLPTISDVATLLPKSAFFDSIVLIMKPSGYYYGDTTKPFSISVYELAEQPAYDIEGRGYTFNTNTVALKAGGPIATWSKTIKPSFRDSVKIRLDDPKGRDFFEKLQSKAPQVSSETSFLDYFKGLCIQPSNTNGAAVYGFNLADSSIRMRIYYHRTIPYKVNDVLDFTLTRTSYQFNRIITDRTGTTLEPTFSGQREFFANATNPFSFTQAGTGVYLKARFPSLRSLLKINEVVRLMDAKLVLKPVKGTYDNYVNKLPNPLFMQTTDASNIAGNQLGDTTGQGPQFRSPMIDELYGINTTYTFNITSYINALLNTPGTAEHGLFIVQSDPHASKQINRAVIGGRLNANYQTKLVLNILTIE